MPGSSNYDNTFLNKVIELIEKNLSDERYGVSELAGDTGMSRSNLLRKTKKLTGLSVSQFVRQVRLENAPFDDMLGWLHQMEFTEGLLVHATMQHTGFAFLEMNLKIEAPVFAGGAVQVAGVGRPPPSMPSPSKLRSTPMSVDSTP